MGVYELSGAGSAKTPRTIYSSMNANNQYGAMVPIANTTVVGSSTSTVTFSAIPQTYQDLFVVGYYRNSSASSQGLNIYPNGSGASDKSNTFLNGDGTTASSSRNSSIAIQNYLSTTTLGTGIFESTEIHILNYAQSTTLKTFLMRRAADNNGSGVTTLSVGLWSATPTLMTSLLLTAPSGTFTEGSTFTLYGIRAVSS